jgi:hypothetical protein
VKAAWHKRPSCSPRPQAPVQPSPSGAFARAGAGLVGGVDPGWERVQLEVDPRRERVQLEVDPGWERLELEVGLARAPADRRGAPLARQ